MISALRVDHLVIDASNPRVLATFWSQVLGRPIANDSDGFLLLAPDEGGVRLAFAAVPEAKTVKNRLHLDLETADRERTIDDLIAIGASVVDTRTSGDHIWTVMADPEGNEFCIF